MNVVIVAPCHVPLAIGGAEKLWWGLLAHLNRETSHQADIIKLPVPEGSFWEVVDSYRQFSTLDVRPYDAIITGKYPAWMTDHPCQVCYMLHPLRGLYDTYPPGSSLRCESDHPDLRGLLELVRSGADSREALAECFDRLDVLRRLGVRGTGPSLPEEAFAFPGPLIREVVHFFDRVAFRPGAVRRFCAISATVAGREGYFPAGADVAVVHPPSDLTGFRRPRRGRYLFTVSRLDAPKRVDLLIAAMREVPGDLELIIAGMGPDEPRLRALAAGDPRIRFLGYVNDSELLDLYASALAVLFAPIQEDFGLVTLEAMAAGKPVVTTVDAGGPGELVEDGRTGFVTAPEPAAMAARIRQLVGNRRLARRMGAAALDRARHIAWSQVESVVLNGIEP